MAPTAQRPPLSADRMRRMDYWLGVPLCLVLTIVRRINDLFRPSHDTAHRPPESVLFIELAEMGTTVLAYPALHRLNTLHPGCRVFFLVFKHIDESVRVLGLVPDERTLTIDASSLWTVARDTIRFMRLSRRHRIDTVVNLEMFARFSTILTFLSGARRRVGFHRFTQEGLYLGRLLTHEVMYNPHLHTWQSLVALVDATAEPATDVPMGKFPAATEWRVPPVQSDAEARRRILDLVARENPQAAGKRLIVVNPNASKLIPVRRWPLDRYAALVAGLLGDPANACVITGTAAEREEARFIVDRVASDRVVNLAGKTSLRELIDLFNVAALLVTNDSGPAHFAALTPIHIVVFFGPETPDLYRPLSDNCTPVYAEYACSPCVSAYNQRRTACTDNKCLQHFSVDGVLTLIRRILT
jgi:ADP-heptose:LPS heptosyltransferase